MSRFANGPMEPPKQYSSVGAVEQQRAMVQRELLMMQVGTPAWFAKQQELTRLDVILQGMRR